LLLLLLLLLLHQTQICRDKKCGQNAKKKITKQKKAKEKHVALKEYDFDN
jgi:hypothetical protein